MNRQSAVQSHESMQEGNSGKLQSTGRIPLWVSIVVTLGGLLLAIGAVISKINPTLLTNGSPMTEAAHIYADYLFARNLPLAGMLFLLLALRSRRMLSAFMVLIALIQIVDVLNDLTRGAFLLVPGLLVFAIVFLLGARRLFGQSLWRVDNWV